ncbi:MAG: hypothetical protein KFF68_05980 [Desulfosarcina sp.]|nr:hypothetical protein [Desulfosarcina sp.]
MTDTTARYATANRNPNIRFLFTETICERRQNTFPLWNPDARIDIIDGADPFFFGFLDEITRRRVQRIQPCD